VLESQKRVSESINQTIEKAPGCLAMESSGENSCVYGLGECPVMIIMGDKMKQLEQRGKVLPQDPGAAAVSQMIQPLLQMNANVYAMLPSYCPNCPKRIVAVEKELLQLRKVAD
jgi:hypothetical protein